MSNHLKNYTLTLEQHKLIVAAMPFAFSIARTRLRVGVELDDLKQQAYLGLCDAADNFIPDGKAAFTTFAERHVTESIDVFLKHYGPGKILSHTPEDTYVDTVTIERPESDDPDALALEDIIPDTAHQKQVEEFEQTLHNRTVLRSLTACLTEDERRMVYDFYQCSTQEERASLMAKYHLSRTPFYTRLRVAILKMKAYAAHKDVVSTSQDNSTQKTI